MFMHCISNVHSRCRHSFLVDVALGIVARTVPQLNIFVVGFPIKIGVSLYCIIHCYGGHVDSRAKSV